MLPLARPLAVALVSAGSLAFEILLIRIFAIEQFYHFAYMVVGVAMLGFGASGTVFTLIRQRRFIDPSPWFAVSTTLTAVALLGVPLLVGQVDVDPTRLAWDPGQWLRLAVVYLLLALPFGLGALAVLSAIAAEPDRPGTIYGASFVGSGVGAALGIAILWTLEPVRALALPPALAALGAVCTTSWAKPGRMKIGIAAGVLVASIAGAIHPFRQLSILPYKALPQVSAFPDARRTAEHTSPSGWVVAVESPAFRHAPGLSLAYRGAFPQQTALFVDAELAGASTRWPDSSASAMLDWLPTSAPYAIGDRRSVLVIDAGGSLEVANAVAHRAVRVVALELQPALIDLTAPSVSDQGALGTGAEIEWISGDARGYISRTDDRFDLITMGPIGGGVVGAGMRSLSEDFLHTVDAYVRLLDRLNDGGVLAITGWTAVPPRTNLRVILTVVEALRRIAPKRIDRALLVTRSWGTVTTLVKPEGFTAEEIAAVSGWATARLFDIEWHPDLAAPLARFNLTDEPTIYEATSAALSSRDSAARFAATYPFDVRPATDARPYPQHFVGTRALSRLLGSSRGDWLPFAEWGFVALLATLAQSVLLAGIMLLLPAIAGAGRVGMRRLAPLVGYFGAIGFAYMAAEIAAIQQLTLLLGHPVYAVAAVLTALLVASGMGSAWSDRLPAALAFRVTGLLVLILATYGVVLLGVVHLFQPAPLALRFAAAMVMLAPVAVLMGMPFPLGLRTFASESTDRVAWAWAANGFASVVAAPLAALTALEYGSRVLFVAAAAAYLVAAVAHWRARAQTA